MLARAIPYMPVGVHLAVVDPGVGGARRAVAIRTHDGRLFVGPDNGLLTLAAPLEQIEAGAAPDERALPPRARLADVPRARRLRAGRGASRGRRGPRRPRRGDRPGDARLDRPAGADGRRAAASARSVLVVDRFGNLQLNVDREHIAAFGVEPGDRVELRLELDPFYAVVAETYEEASRGELMLYEDSYGSVRDRDQRRRRGRADRRRPRATRSASPGPTTEGSARTAAPLSAPPAERGCSRRTPTAGARGASQGG